jgi:hypothetical protein
MTGLVKGLLVLALLSGSVTGTAFAADASLPGQPLYPVDLMLEDVQEALTLQPGTLAQFEVRRVEERAYELNTMAERGRVPNAEQAERLRTQLQVALRTTSRLEDAQMAQELLQLQTMAQQQTRLMTQLGLAQEAGIMTQAMVQVQYGLDDPAGFRAAFQLGNGPMNDNAPGGQDTVTPGPANGAGNGAQQGNQGNESPGGGQMMTPSPNGNNDDPGNPNTGSGTPVGNQQRSGQTATPAPEGNGGGPGPGDGQGQQPGGSSNQGNGGSTDANPGGDNGNGGGNQGGGGH